MFSSFFPTRILGAFGSATKRINKNEDMTEMRTCRVPQNPSQPFSPLDKIEERGSEMISEELTSGKPVNMWISRCFVVCNGSIQDGFHRDQRDRPWWIWSNHAVHSPIGRNEIRCRDWNGSVSQIKEINLEDSMQEYQKILREVKLLALLKTNYIVRYYSVGKREVLNCSAGPSGTNAWKRRIWFIRTRMNWRRRKIRSMKRR